MRNIPYSVKYLTLGPQLVELDGEAVQPCGHKNVPGGGLGAFTALSRSISSLLSLLGVCS